MSCLPCCGVTSPPPPPPDGCFSDIDTIMSQNGLITDCHAGIKPQPGEILAVQMQANGYAGIRDAAKPITIGYALSRYRDVVQSPAGFPPIHKSQPDGGFSVQDSPCNFIWWTKNRCLGKQDQYFPQANACGCMGTDPVNIECSTYVQNDGLYSRNNLGEPCGSDKGGGGAVGWEWPLNYTVESSPDKPQNLICGDPGQEMCEDNMFGCQGGGECQDATNVCCRYHYKPANTQREYGENEVGTYISELWNYDQVRRRWSYNPEYPPCTKEEAKSAMYKNSFTCPHDDTDLRVDSVVKGCGLTPYQERVSEHLNPDIWEILQYNDKKPIVILNREIEGNEPELTDTGLEVVGNIAGQPIQLSVSSGAKDIAAGPDFLMAIAKYEGITCFGSPEPGGTGSCVQLAGYGTDVVVSFPFTWMTGKGIAKFKGLFATYPSSDSPPYYNHLGQNEQNPGINPVIYTPEWSSAFKLSAGGERCIITRRNGATVTAGDDNPVATQENPWVVGKTVETILFDPAGDHQGSATVPYSPASTGITYNWICQDGCTSCRFPWIGPFTETDYPMRCWIPDSGVEDICPYYQTQFTTCNGTAVNIDTLIPLEGHKVCSAFLGGGTGTFVEIEISSWSGGTVRNSYTLNLCDGVQSWKQIACGLHHNVAINQYGTTGGSNVFCWGASYANQTDFDPSQVGLAKKVAAGYYHNLAIRNNNTLWSWGGGGTAYNKGQSDITQFQSTQFKDIAAGKFHSCGIKSDGGITCWGAGLTGQTGDNNFGQSAPPIELINPGPTGARAKSIACGAWHSCAILTDGGITCWGHSGDNRLNFNTLNKKYNKVVCGEKFSAAKWKPTGFYRSYPIVLPHTNEIIAGNWPHNLFKYFFTFVSQQFSYVRGQIDCLEDGSQPPDLLMNRSLPEFFHQIGDGVHLFSFEFDGDQILQDGLEAICEQSNWDSGYQYGYNKQQLMPQDNIEAVFQAHSDEAWEQNVDRANTVLGQKFKERLQLKDWRKEIHEDIVTLAESTVDWPEIRDLIVKYPNPSTIKCVGPARLPGDKWEIRAAAPGGTGNNPFEPFRADFSKRAPALAKMASPKPESSWPDCYRDEDSYTLQVNQDIYNLPEPPGGVSSLTPQQQSAFYRLTNSVYFRSRAMLPNWEWSPRNLATLNPWPKESDLKHWSRRNHRTAWLQKIGRVLSPPPNDTSVDRYSVMQSVGTVVGGLPSAGPQPYWSVSGQGQGVYPVIQGGIELGSICDSIWGSRMAHLGNSCSFIGRYVPAIPGADYRKNPGQKHTADGEYLPDEIFFDYPEGSVYQPIRHIPHEDSINESSLTSNICFGRFVGRDWTWNNSSVPFKFESVQNPLDHPVDSQNVCSEIPAPKMHPGMASRPWNSRTWIDGGEFPTGGPYFQIKTGGFSPPGGCNGLRPARGIMEWDGPSRPCGSDSRGPEVRAGWMNNFVFDPTTGRMDGGSGCTFIFNKECCKLLETQCDQQRCPNTLPEDLCGCTACTERWGCLEQIRCDGWDGPTYDLYEPTVGASFSGGKTGNSCCFIPYYEGGSSFDNGNPLFAEWRNNAFISLPPIAPTPTSPDGCRNREKASCCFWHEYQPGEFTTSGKHFKTYFQSSIPPLEDYTLGAFKFEEYNNICNSTWLGNNDFEISWANELGISAEALKLFSPDVRYPGLARGRMMCLENDIDPEWQHNPESTPKACIPKGVTLGSAGAFSYADFRMQAKECNADLVVKLNRLLQGSSGNPGFAFTRCYNQSEISGCTQSSWCLPSSSSTLKCGVPLPPGWTAQECGSSGCCVCFGRKTGESSTTHVEDWYNYGSFEQYCKGALNGTYRVDSKCPRGSAELKCSKLIGEAGFTSSINAYKFNCTGIGPMANPNGVIGPGTERPPLECAECTSITSPLARCESFISPFGPDGTSWFEFAKFNPIGYGIWDEVGQTWERAGLSGCCRTPLHSWPAVLGWDGDGNFVYKSDDGGYEANSLDMTYSGPCWPHPGLWDLASTAQESGKILLANSNKTWQPCQHGIFRWNEDSQTWAHNSEGIADEVCQTEAQSTNGNCCSEDGLQAIETVIEASINGEPKGSTAREGYWTKQVPAVQPWASAFVAQGKCSNFNATAGNCWVCPSYKAMFSSGLSCLLESSGSVGCNCKPVEGNDTYKYFEEEIGQTLDWCKCETPLECPNDNQCTQNVCNQDSACCEIGWDADCINHAINLCKCSQFQCPCECRNYEALKWSADQYNGPDGWTGGKTTGLDLLSDPTDWPPGITCEDCRKCDLPLCIHKYNCNLKCPCGTYGMNCEKTCTDTTGFYGAYDKDLLGKGSLVWRSDGGG